MSEEFTVEVKAKGIKACGKTTLLLKVKQLLESEGFKVDDSKMLVCRFSQGLPVETLKARKEAKSQ
jgi:predicted AAA+ superfamily ATPase